VAAPASGAPAASAAAARVSWSPCRDGFQCGTLYAPLDYDRPDGDTIGVSVIRLPAASPDERIGSLFLNPGGPGGSGVDIARGLAQFLPLELRGRFDIVGFDPRGIMRSTPLRCYDRFEQSFQDLPRFPYPVTRKQVRVQKAADGRFAEACRSHGGPILRHMSTADVARDMDLLRQAIGDPNLNYLGYSYGTELGQTYANLFPDRVRAMVIDGVLDPQAWAGKGPRGTTVPAGTRLASAQGAGRTLRAFFRQCDAAGSHCAISGHSRAKYRALVKAVADHQVPGFKKSDLIGISLGALYSPSSWPDFARFLRQLTRASGEKAENSLLALRDELGLEPARQEPYPNFVEGFPGVFCADTTNPDNYRAYRRGALSSKQAYGYFGPIWNWIGSVCAVWPDRAQQDRYTGPWTAATPNPVLVVGNHFDPATRYQGAVKASHLLPNSRLLTYAGWGHTAFFQGNFCVDAAVTAYLTTTNPPAEGTVCQPNGSPFGPVQARAAARRTAGLAATLPPAVREAFRGR
jgi:pimeloyl-ACP methyl ester carboxylesterase